MAKRTPKTYPQWVKSWRKAGSKSWPDVLQVVMIDWTDAAYHETEAGTINAWLIGILEEASDESVTVAMEVFEDQESRTKITVPAGMINHIVTLGTLSLKK